MAYGMQRGGRIKMIVKERWTVFMLSKIRLMYLCAYVCDWEGSVAYAIAFADYELGKCLVTRLFADVVVVADSSCIYADMNACIHTSDGAVPTKPKLFLSTYLK